MKEINCAVCKHLQNQKDKTVNRTSCIGLCTYILNNFCYFLPGGGIELTKPLKHIEEQYARRVAYEEFRSANKKKNKSDNPGE